jgi:arylsulfatase A-like enzyme
MTLNIDIAPTLLDLAGIDVPDCMQGNSVVSLLHGNDLNWRKEWLYEHTVSGGGVRGLVNVQGVRTHDWKYIRYPKQETQFEQLFHLKDDALEQNNLAADRMWSGQLRHLRGCCDVLAGAAA